MLKLSPSAALERGLGQVLAADSELKSIFGDPMRIFTHATEDDQLPYIIYNETRLDDNSDDLVRAATHTVLFQVWDDAEGEYRIKNALSRIRYLIDRDRHIVNAAPYWLASIDYEFQDIRREADGQAYIGTAQFRVNMGER